MLGEFIPALGVLTVLSVPITAFIWLFHKEKGEREAVIEIAKHLDDPAKVEMLMGLFDEKKMRRSITGGAVSLRCLSVWVSICWMRCHSGQYLKESAY